MQPAYECDDRARSLESCKESKTAAAQERAMAAARRKRLSSRAQRECDSLKAAIVDNDDVEELTGARGLMESLQQDTLSLRKRYRELGC